MSKKRPQVKRWKHKEHRLAQYDADITTLKGVRKFRLELVVWVDIGQEKLPPQRKYFKSWQAAKKAGFYK